MAKRLTIIIPTKNRCDLIRALLASIKNLRGLRESQPEIIIGDNNSTDQTWEILQRETNSFPVPLRLLRVTKPGKSAVLNEAIRIAEGRILAFLDDDVIVQSNWLLAIEQFFREEKQAVGQGAIRILPSSTENPEIRKLINRYRTIPNVDFGPDIEDLHSLNGANFAVSRQALNSVGPFDERLGPGAAGTSEDVEFARRLIRAGFRIGYMREAIVYHHVDPLRLTEDYFRTHHKRQGQSRILINDKRLGHIFFDLGHATARFAFYSLGTSERDRYRSKGRIYHYLGMLQAKLKKRNYA